MIMIIDMSLYSYCLILIYVHFWKPGWCSPVETTSVYRHYAVKHISHITLILALSLRSDLPPAAFPWKDSSSSQMHRSHLFYGIEYDLSFRGNLPPTFYRLCTSTNNRSQVSHSLGILSMGMVCFWSSDKEVPPRHAHATKSWKLMLQRGQGWPQSPLER